MSENSLKTKYVILIYVILLISSTTAALLAVKNIKISPDSMRFGLVSQQILSGNGIRVPIVRLEDNYVPVNGAIPFLDQMPLVPILFAALGGFSFQNYFPAQFSNAVAHIAITIFTFLIMRRLYGNSILALLTGLVVSFSFPLLWAADHVTTESIFIAFTVASIYFLIVSRQSKGNQYVRYLFFASLCAVASILTRNAGIAIVPVFLWEAIFLLKNKRPESRMVSTYLLISLPIVTIILMFVRNYVVSGSLRGFNQASPERSFMEAVAGTVKMIFQQFRLGNNAIIVITSIVIFCITYILLNRQVRKEAREYMIAGLDLIWCYLLIYTGLICLTMAIQQWQFEMRFVFPLVPFIFVGIILMVSLVRNGTRMHGFSKLSSLGMAIFLGIISFGSGYKTYMNFSEFSYRQEKAYSLLDSCTYRWLKEEISNSTMIATNRPFHLAFFGGYPTVALPHKRYNPTINVPDDMERVLPEKMSYLGASLLALFEKADKEYEGKYIADLFNRRRSHGRFILKYECSDGVVYSLKE
jgi:hypothetical protein